MWYTVELMFPKWPSHTSANGLRTSSSYSRYRWHCADTLMLPPQLFCCLVSIISLALLWSSTAVDDNAAIVSILGSGCMLEISTASAVTRESEFIRLIGSILIVSLGWMAVSSGLNLIRVGAIATPSSKLGRFNSWIVTGSNGICQMRLASH